VGFQVDPGVQTFDVVMLLAADLAPVPVAPASIVLSANSAEFVAGGVVVTPMLSVIQVMNGGGGTLSGLDVAITYAEGQPVGWLQVALGAIAAPTMLTLWTPANLLPVDGKYHATATVSAPGASNSPQAVSITLDVVGSLAGDNSIFVSESDPSASDDATCGLSPTGFSSSGHPCLTISQGLARAVATGRWEVLVADGRYSEAVTLANGKSLLGGYHPVTWQRHLASTNTIIDGVSSTGSHDRTVIATAITASTVFEGFVVRGSVNSKPGGNSYAIYIASSGAHLVIRANIVYGGVGGPGSQGAVGSSGIGGTGGTGRDSDPAGYDARIATGTGQCSPSNDRSHANGGVLVVGGNAISGGNGGGNRCPPTSTLTQFSALDGIAGRPGAGAGGGAAGAAGGGGLDARLESGGTVCVVPGSMAGRNGARGGDGAPGAGASGGVSQTGGVLSGHWTGSSGGTGGSGFNGGGGGGGGAGGGSSCVGCLETKDRLGGHAGGGGAGGAGAGGGVGGSAGGGAFGIFVFTGSAPVVTGNTLIRGTGGTGGAGGGAGAGGVGGNGADGGLGSVSCTGAAGRGGDGGNGGHGGGGGGGSGGASFGIYTHGVGTPNYCLVASGNAISGGSGGSGGPGGFSPVNPGTAGVSGALAACVFIP
jgi:hypothetical protein